MSNSYAQDTERERHSYEDWEYITNTSGLTLVSYLGRESELEIPAEIHGISVTMLGDDIFKNFSFLRSVVIPDTVTSIGRTAFQGCSSLKEIYLPKKLTRIEPYTFRYCTALEKIKLPETLVLLSEYCFSGCISLNEIEIPNSVTSIYQNAFDDCTSLVDVTISKNLTYLGPNAFLNTPWLSQQTKEGPVLVGNTVLLKWNGTDSTVEIPYGVTMITDAFKENIYVESIIIPSSVTRIGLSAFQDAVNLKNVVIPDTVTSIGASAFQGNRSLRSISLPDSITNLENSAFRGCERLSQVNLPSKITSIGSYLFADCVSLTDVTIPSAVQSIHDTAFSGSRQVRLHVTFDSEAERFAQEQQLPYTYYMQQTKDFIYSKNDDGIQILKYIGNLFEVDIPGEIDGMPVNRINTAAFQNNQIVRHIVLPDSVKTIGDWAFSYMDSLKSIRMSSGLTSLGADAFTGSVSMKTISLPDAIEYIGVEPFEGIEELTICASPDSHTGELLNDLGYSVTDGDECADSDFLNNIGILPTETDISMIAQTKIPAVTSTKAPDSSFTQIPVPTVTPTPTPVMTFTPTMTPTPELISILYVPDGSKNVTRDMLAETSYELTLILPESVTFIDEGILQGHTLTLVAESGSEAEAFARKWDTKFLIRTWYEIDHRESGE